MYWSSRGVGNALGISPISTTSALGSTAYEEGKKRLQIGMSAKVWSYRLRKRTIQVLRQFVSIEKEHEGANHSDGIVPCKRPRITS